MYKEKIASFQIENKRIQMLQMTIPTKTKYYNPETKTYEFFIYKYQIRINRKRYKTNIESEYIGKKYLCSLITEILLQQKFTF